MRYMIGSRRLKFGDAISIFARSVRAPSANTPAFMRAKRSRLSSTLRSDLNAVHDRVAQIEVWRRHIDLRAERARVIGKHSGFHAREEVEVVLHAAIRSECGT